MDPVSFGWQSSTGLDVPCGQRSMCYESSPWGCPKGAQRAAPSPDSRHLPGDRDGLRMGWDVGTQVVVALQGP